MNDSQLQMFNRKNCFDLIVIDQNINSSNTSLIDKTVYHTKLLTKDKKVLILNYIMSKHSIILKSFRFPCGRYHH